MASGEESWESSGGGETVLTSGYSSDRGLEGRVEGVVIEAGVLDVSVDVLVHADPAQASDKYKYMLKLFLL